MEGRRGRIKKQLKRQSEPNSQALPRISTFSQGQQNDILKI